MIGTKRTGRGRIFLFQKENIKLYLQKLEWRKNLFTKEEFKRFIDLATEAYTLGKKSKISRKS